MTITLPVQESSATLNSKNRLLVVCDFDWSLVEENSDTWVLSELGATALFESLKETGELTMFWGTLMQPFNVKI
jgi:hypothetical protein